MEICFLSLNSYPVLTKEDLGYVGGAEVEQVHLGAQLASLGHGVSFVTYGQNSNFKETYDGIRIIKSYEREKNGIMNPISKCTNLMVALNKANADLYFHEAGSYGVLPMYSMVKRKKFVHRIASDAIVLGTSLDGRNRISENLANQFEIKKAKVIIAQSEFQKKILKERFRIESVIIKNGLVLPKVEHRKPDSLIVLWVGTISAVKNPELFIELARQMPNVYFEMIGGRGEPPQLYDKITASAKSLSNLKFHGFVPYNRINEYFGRAAVFVNTSHIEGFPNTFIQAWANCIPVVSLNVDPDGLLSGKKLGFFSRTFNELMLDIMALLDDRKLRENIGCKSRQYVEENHDVRKVVKDYCAVFESTL